MSNIIKKPYEISLWDDDLVFRVKYIKDGKEVKVKEYLGSLKDFEEVEGATTEITQYYKERKICVIGSNTMDTPVRAINSKLISNVNGSNTLNFSIYSKYWDEDSEQFYDNPFLKLLVNERKVKLRYGALGSEDCKWYDLIIKNIQENSETKTFNYTAKDLFVNELSKSGFELVLDPELENNMGNITKLAETILEGSDWELGEENSILLQTKEEPLYEIILNQNLKAKNMQDESDEINISSGKTIYGFYTPITNQEPYFQLLYVDGDYEVDDDYVIINSKNWFCEGISYDNEGKPNFAKSMVISSEFRGKRIVRQAQTIYDSTIDKYVYSYNNGSYYGYTESEYISPTTVSNFTTSPNTFTSFSGWEVGGALQGEKVIYPTLELQGFPDPRISGFDENQNYTSFLKYRANADNQLLFNSGIMDHRSGINGFTEDEEFVLRIKYATANKHQDGIPTSITYQSQMPTIKIGIYSLSNGVYSIEEELFSAIGAASYNNNTIQSILKCKRAMSYSEMIEKRIGIFIVFNKNQTYYLEDFQFFRYIKDDEGNIILPDSELKSIIRTKYYYYIPNKEYSSIEDVQYVYKGYEPMLNSSQDYNDNQFEKIRSITAKETNRFNLIQTLCETFECWPKFEIKHNMNTGEILLDEDNGYRQKKFLTFHEYIGKENHVGFKYGINLKSIQRTLDSSGAVSKIIVKNNANEFAESGFCSIARATENPIGENFIYDFSYYIQQGLIGFSEINNDLYLDTTGYLGYYKKLRQLNKNRDNWIEEQVGLNSDISNFSASYQTYKISVESAEEELRATEIEIFNLTGYTYSELVGIYNGTIPGDIANVQAWWEDKNLIGKINKLAQLKNTIARHKVLRDNAKTNLDKSQARFSELEDLLKNLTTEKRVLNLRFYKKYSRFIQEGSWIKEDYIDDNLYFLDAENTLHTSSQPKVTYNIGVLELSQLPDYENYTFNLGDKTYMEDTEFFGWTWKGANKIKTPYREEIVVTEFTTVLDSPEQNSIKVQNYKTQFEDLFQRITATTQSIEYHTGEYGRAASIIETDGTILADTLQNSITNNAIRLENAKDQTVIWDDTGITTTSLSKPNEMVRIISGGVFMSVDGGVTWNTGLTGSGINATYITSGQINTGAINIMNNGTPSFRWDGVGISAYQFQIDENTGNPYGFNIGKFVRFDQYGIYGINGNSEFTPSGANSNEAESSIWNEAKFALTWKGFMLRNDDGSVRISSDEDIQVLQGNSERIKIGRLEKDKSVYGIRIKNADGATVMETVDNGQLWLKDSLSIETYNNKKVAIGKLDTIESKDDAHGSRVIDANSSFIVYEDGYMKATGGQFTGTIFATGGKIGNLEINQLDSITYRVEITSSKGTVIRDGTEIELTAHLYSGTDEILEGLTYQWYETKNKDIVLGYNKTYQTTINFNPELKYAQYGCKIMLGGKVINE